MTASPLLLRSPLLSVPHGFSTRAGGVSEGCFASLNLGRSVGDDLPRVEENARRLASEAGLEIGRFVCVSQVHGDALLEASEAPGGTTLPPPMGEADGLYTRTPGVALTIRTADCGPVLLWAPDVGAVAAVHAGWRGAAAAIAGRAVATLARSYGADPKRMRAVVGPCIHPCCYPIGAEVAAVFRERFPASLVEGEGGPRLDLARASRLALLEAGVPGEQVETLPLCTSCRADLFFSHRRDAGRTGRHVSFIALPDAARPLS